MSKKTHFHCSDCEEKHHIDFIEEIEVSGEDLQLCSNCHCNYSFCEDCDIWIHNDDSNYINDRIICDDCRNENYIECEECEEHTQNDYVFYALNEHSDSVSLCEGCYNHTQYCDQCDETFTNDVLFTEINDNYYCDNCHSKQSKIIKSYSYNPPSFLIKLADFNSKYMSKEQKFTSIEARNFHRITDTNFKSVVPFNRLQYGQYENTKNVIGFELEVECKNGNREEIAKNLINKIDDKFIYLKEDSSINNGFEIVSHPQSFKAWQNTWQLYKPIFDLPSEGARSHNTETCGLHFSINRETFTPLHALKFAMFIYWNPLFIKDLSRRKWNNLFQWANLFPYSYNDYKINGNDENIKELNIKLMKQNNQQAFLTSQNKDFVFLYNKKALSKGHRNGRYTALNTENSNRIEARFFRGTLKESTFFMNLEFIHSAVEFTRNASIKELNVFNYKNFTKENNYNNIYNYLESIPQEKFMYFIHYYMDAVQNETRYNNNELPIEYFSIRDNKDLKEVY